MPLVTSMETINILYLNRQLACAHNVLEGHCTWSFYIYGWSIHTWASYIHYDAAKHYSHFCNFSFPKRIFFSEILHAKLVYKDDHMWEGERKYNCLLVFLSPSLSFCSPTLVLMISELLITIHPQHFTNLIFTSILSGNCRRSSRLAAPPQWLF